MLGLLTQLKKGINLETKNKPKLPENRTVWKSDNQEIEEETFIQTGALRQRNVDEMKEQIKTPEPELSNKEIGNLSDAEFKTL